MKIRGILIIYTSARDRNGNCYHSAQYTDTDTGAFVRFRDVGGESNMRGLARLLGFGDYDSDHIYSDHQVLGIREYQRLTRDWPYNGNGADSNAVALIRAAIREASK